MATNGIYLEPIAEVSSTMGPSTPSRGPSRNSTPSRGPSRTSTPTRGPSALREKLRFSITVEDRMQSQLLSMSDSGIFSYIDPRNTGYAMPNEIIALWESLGIPQGTDILDYLMFDLHKNVNLVDLSSALEQEVTSTEADNAIYQAAVASFFCEMNHVNTLNEQLISRQSQLEMDLHAANCRIECLIKESEEITARLTDATDNKLGSLAKRHEVQLKTLISDAEEQHQGALKEMKQLIQNYETQIAALENSEHDLKQKLNNSDNEVTRLEGEVEEIGKHCILLGEKTQRLQRELESVTDLHIKLDDLDSSKQSVQDEQLRFQDQKVQSLQIENTNLKDQSDELTLELEELRQRLAGSRRRSRTYRSLLESCGVTRRNGSVLGDYIRHPGADRKGSVLADYIRPPGADSSLIKESDENDVDKNNNIEIRKLRSQLSEEREKRMEVEEMLKGEILDLDAGHKARIHEIREEHEKDKLHLQQMFQEKFNQLENKYKEERDNIIDMISKAQETQEKETEAEFNKKLEQEKENWYMQMEAETEMKLKLKEEEMLSKAEAEKQHLLQMHEIEKCSIHKHYAPTTINNIFGIVPPL